MGKGFEYTKHFSKEDTQVAKSTWKDAQHHSSVGKWKSKAQWDTTVKQTSKKKKTTRK